MKVCPCMSNTESENINSLSAINLIKEEPAADIYAYRNQKLYITLNQARYLLPHDTNGLSDPYCTFKLGHKGVIKKTPTCIQTLTPVWNYSMEFDLGVTDYYLKVDLYDEDRLKKDDWMGRFFVPIFSFYFLKPNLDGTVSQWFQLQRAYGTKGEEIPIGEILITIKPPFPYDNNFENLVKLFHINCNERGFEINTLGIKNNEIVEACLDNILLSLSGHHYTGALYVTNYRVCFISNALMMALIEEKEFLLSIPYSTILEITRGTDDIALRSPANVITVFCSDFRDCIFIINLNQHSETSVINIYKRLIFARANASSFPIAFKLYENLSEKPLINEKWEIGNMENEFKRQNITEQWKLSEINSEYLLCSTYPSQLFLPRGVSNEIVQKASLYRSRNRIPTLTWFDNNTGNVIVRSSQPLAGVTNKSSSDDEALIEAIRLSTPNARLTIFDARSQVAADANKVFNGKGAELIEKYTNCKLVFLSIGNIHVMRHSFERLRTLICATANAESSWLSALASTEWLNHIQIISDSAITIASYISSKKTSVLLHCSDGWDRTSQLVSVAQILLDPYYRTLKGFQVLIEKDWLAFGHKFKDRCCLVGTDDFSPVFLQFLDVTWQIMQQFPSAFEFNEDFLLDIYQAVNSSYYGNFLFNSEKERQEANLSSTTLSYFHIVASQKARFMNPFYSPIGVITNFIASVKVLRLWPKLYLFFDEIYLLNRFQPSRSYHRRVRSPRKNDFKSNNLNNLNDSSVSIDSPTLIHESSSISTGEPVEEQSEQVLMHSLRLIQEAPLHKRKNSLPLPRPIAAISWMNDNDSSFCYYCHANFTLFKRRHHCRKCGLLFCSDCTKNKALLPELGYGKVPQKVCDSCSREYL